MFVRRDPPFDFGLQVEATVAGVVAVAEVAANPARHPLHDLDLSWLDGFREVGVGERVVAAPDGGGGQGEEGEELCLVHGSREE